MQPAPRPSLPSWTVPTRRGAAWFRVRVWGHVVLRAARQLFAARVQRHRAAARLADAAIIAERRSALWHDGRPDEFALVAGKVENLRVARRAFDGVVVPAGAVFSFWKQLGRPARWRGFVEGREIRAGCVIPVVAGGLCQLSNALATCAASCGIALIERHGHTARIEQGDAPGDAAAVDATVLWSYIDLRLSAPFEWRLEVELTGDELVVRMRAARAPSAHAPALAHAIRVVTARESAPLARGCLTCDETRCHRYPDSDRQSTTGATAVLVNARTPEFDHYLRDLGAEATWYVPWLRPARRAAGAWRSVSSNRVVAVGASLGRTWLLRRQSGEAGGRQEASMRGDRWLAASFARRLEPRHTHLVVDQSLLVALSDLGALQGRTYDVLMPALPAGEIQRRLDDAATRWPQAASLRDLRVSPRIIDAELRALRGARRVVTPHAEAARHLRALGLAQVEPLEWQPTSRSNGGAVARAPATSPIVAFPASALPRKGALELAEALRHLGWRLLVLGMPSTDPCLWRGIEVEHSRYADPRWLDRADVIALPAHVEHAPRALLSALAHGLPVVATRACGLPSSPGLHEVDAGDVTGLIAALQRATGR